MSADATKFYDTQHALITIPEKTTPSYEAMVYDGMGNVIGSDVLDELTLTLINLADETIINGRLNQDVRNANNVTVTLGGLLTYSLQIADTTMQDQTKSREVHRAIFYMRYATTKHWRWQVDFTIHNISMVP